jgi:hypothetical protein
MAAEVSRVNGEAWTEGSVCRGCMEGEPPKLVPRLCAHSRRSRANKLVTAAPAGAAVAAHAWAGEAGPSSTRDREGRVGNGWLV